MKDMVINSLELICKIAFVVMLAIGIIAFVGCLSQGRPLAAIGCVVVIFASGVFAFGGIFLMLEMNENLRAIRKSLEEKNETKSA